MKLAFKTFVTLVVSALLGLGLEAYLTQADVNPFQQAWVRWVAAPALPFGQMGLSRPLSFALGYALCITLLFLVIQGIARKVKKH